MVGPQHFSKTFRLLNQKDFDHLKIGSRATWLPGIRVYYKPTLTESRGNTRIGISASRKFGNAVNRNLIKRNTREFFRKSRFKELGLDCLVVYFPEARELYPNYNSLEKALGKVFEKIQKNKAQVKT